MKIVISGGGTGGSVTALLAISEAIRRHVGSVELHFIGTSSGPERLLSRSAGVEFTAINAGKLRRYADLRNIFAPLRILRGLIQALLVLRRYRPDVIISTGSYVAVPVTWAGWLLGIPCFAHQLDLDFGLANKLMLPFVKKITVGFEETKRSMVTAKAVCTGNPVRSDILRGTRERAWRLFELKPDLKTILVIGGGTGALRINQLVASSALRLLNFYQIIHLTGQGKGVFSITHPNYHAYEFLLDEMKDAIEVADIVICRAGLSTLTEMSVLGKPTIVVPIPRSHQMTNARYFQRRDAAIVVDEELLTDTILVEIIHELMDDEARRKELSEKIKSLGNINASETIAHVILSSLKK